MEVTKEDAIVWKKKLLEILEFFVDFCNKNGLKYYCCGGTALGAVRHQGFIPWDDDIDVIMPRPDYAKSIKLWQDHNNDRFEFITCDNTKRYIYTFGKLCLKDTTLIEIETQPYIEGLYIDVFAADGCSSDIEAFKKDMDAYRNLEIKLETVSVPFDFMSRFKYVAKGYLHALRAMPYYFIKPFLSRNNVLREVEKIYNNNQYCNSEYVVNYAGSYHYKERIRKEWLGEGRTAKFENIEVVIPSDYDSYLSHIYGDYMKLPPREKQIGHHFAAYYNLNERVSLEEARKFIK